jgi:hypothetical protein
MRYDPNRIQAGLPTILALTVLALLASCENHTTAPPAPRDVSTTYTIRDVDYIKNTFFLLDDPADFLGAMPGTIQVFMSVNAQDLVNHPDYLRLPGWAVPDSTASGTMIDALMSALAAGSRPKSGLQTDFRRLSEGTDFSLLATSDSVVVGIEMKQPVPDGALHAIAVRYRNQLGHDIGAVHADTLVLEMIKAPEQRPHSRFATTWRLTMRNAYYLGSANPTARWSVKIVDVLNTTRVDASTPQGSDVSYLTIFGLDRHDEAGTGPPDGKLDNFFLGWSADMKRGIMWMPALNAFAPPAERVDVWTNGAFSFTGPYQAQYDTSSTIYTRLLNDIQELDVHQYLIEATATIRQP